MPREMESSNMMSQNQMQSGGHPYICVVGPAGTAVIDPANWRLIRMAPGVPGLLDNHYRDQFGRLWSDSTATPLGTMLAGVFVSDSKTFRNENTISLGQNVLETVGLTPDGKFAVVPVPTANELHVFDTKSYQRVATVGVGVAP